MKKTVTPTILVCVTDQLSCARLIHAGSDLAKKYDASVQVLSVLPEGIISQNTAEIMQSLFDITTKAGAEMNYYFNNSPAITVAVHARKVDAIHIVSGVPGTGSNLFIETIKGLLPEIPLTLIDGENERYTLPPIETGYPIKTEILVKA